MGTIRVEGLGDVEIAGGTPTEEESRAIASGFQEHAQSKIDLTPLATYGDEAIAGAASHLPEFLQPIARAAMKTPRDIAYKGVQALAMPFVAAKDLTNAATLPLDVYDYAKGTDLGRTVRKAIPQVDAGTAADIGGGIGAFATGAGALGALSKLAKVPEAAGALGSTLRRIASGATVGTAVTDPDRPTVGNMIPYVGEYLPGTQEQRPSLENRGAHLVDQTLLAGAIEPFMAAAPGFARGTRDLAQGLFGDNGVARKTAQGYQAAAGGAEAAKKAAAEIEASLAQPGIPGVDPTVAERTTNRGLWGVEAKYGQTASRTPTENQAPSTILAERNAANQKAATTFAEENVPKSPDAAAPLAQEAETRAQLLEDARGAEVDGAQKALDDATNRAEAEVAGRKKMAADDAATAQADLDAEHAALPQYPIKTMGDASEGVEKVLTPELARMRGAKNDAFDAMRTDAPVIPDRVASTLAEVLDPRSDLSGATDRLARIPIVARLIMKANNLDPKVAIENLANKLFDAAVSTSEGANALNMQFSTLGKEAQKQTKELYLENYWRPEAARQLKLDPNNIRASTLTTTDLIDATPQLSKAIADARKANDGELVDKLIAIKKSLAIRTPEDVIALLGSADTAHQALAADALEKNREWFEKAKRFAGAKVVGAAPPLAPTAVLPTYLGGGGGNGFRENATQLLNTINGVKDPATIQAATGNLRDFLIGALASKIPESGKLTPQVVRQFQETWSELIDRMPPSLKAELDGLAQRAGAKQAQVATTQERLKAASGLKPEDIEVPRPGVDPTLNDLRTRVEQAAKASPEEVAINQLGDKLGKDPVAAFAAGMEHARPLSADGIGPLLKLASTDAQKDALKGIASMHMKQLLGDDLSGAAKMLADPMKRAALEKVFSPSEMARLDLVNRFALGRKAIENAPSTGAFPTLKEPETKFIKALMDFAGSPGRVGKIASWLKDSVAGGNSKAVAERALMDVLTNPQAALKALRLNTADEGAAINFLKGYASQTLPGASITGAESVRQYKEKQR